MNLRGAIYDRLAADSALVGMLATWTDSEGVERPAIFTGDRIPKSLEGLGPLPRIDSAGNVADEPNDTKTDFGRRPTRDIYCRTGHGDTGTVEAIAERVRDLFHAQPLQAGAWVAYDARCSGPILISSDDYDARLVTVRWRVAR